ncbi:hypothetical protein DFH28DRAFT_928260 [Melampsora americana]|nr:hypothetical protein DFH28DRAFT_928260 [Melampsora americana]
MNSPIIVFLSLFCGVTGMCNLDPYTRMIAGLVVNKLHDLRITCAPEEFSRIQPPSGQTCQQWLSPFVNSSGGYVENPDATLNCDYCQYRVGDECKQFQENDIQFGDLSLTLYTLTSHVVFTALNYSYSN